MIVTGKELAQAVGLKQSSITDAKNRNKLVNSKAYKSKYDTEDTINKSWLLKHGLDQDLEKIAREDKEPEIPDDLAGFPTYLLDMALREAVPRMGGVAIMDLFASVLKKVLDAENREVRNSHLRGGLIGREFVRVKIGTYLHELHQGLFDLAETLPGELVAIVRSCDDDATAESKIRERISKDFERMIESAKRKVNGQLK